MTKLLCCLSAVAFSTAAFAAEPATPPAGTPDAAHVGPLSRPVSKQDKKGVDELYKSFEEAMKKSDLPAMADLVDFPVVMMTDDSQGVVHHLVATREQFTEMMKPLLDMPKDGVKVTHKHASTFLSDTLAAVIEDSSISGKVKGKWKGVSVVTKKDDKWKFKEMAEAGWGDMKPLTTAAK